MMRKKYNYLNHIANYFNEIYFEEITTKTFFNLIQRELLPRIIFYIKSKTIKVWTDFPMVPLGLRSNNPISKVNSKQLTH